MISRNSDGHGLDGGFPDYRTYEDSDTRAADDYISHFGPTRVLRGVEVKRRLIQAASSWVHDEPDGTLTLAMAQECWRKALALLATEWDTHPDYRPDWSL